MKILSILFLIALATTLAKAQTNPVVIELFTSQGCSSCPAADKNLTEILQQAKKDGNEVFGLSFHVDYWNYIGWKDPYSSKEFTARQRKYGEEMNLRSIYTPQMIVNGKNEFVGSSVDESKRVVATAFKQKPLYQIVIKDFRVISGVLHLKYSLDQEPNGEVINMAIVEREVENYVPRGENSGRKLHHDNVVRSFATSAIKREQELQLQIPEMNVSKASVILYIQNKDWNVVGAISKAFN
jgi:hypothetical protein